MTAGSGGMAAGSENLLAFQMIHVLQVSQPEMEGDAGRFFEFQLFFAEKAQMMSIIVIFQGRNVSRRWQGEECCLFR